MNKIENLAASFTRVVDDVVDYIGGWIVWHFEFSLAVTGILLILAGIYVGTAGENLYTDVMVCLGGVMLGSIIIARLAIIAEWAYDRITGDHQ